MSAGTANSSVKGVITSDPGISAPIGDEIFFQAQLVIPRDGVSGTYAEELSAFCGMVLALHFGDAQAHEVSGSAVVVAPGVAISAKHVVSPHFDAILSGKRQFLATGIRNGVVQSWAVDKITELAASDLVILGLILNSALPSDRILSQVSITTRLPEVGESLEIVGFRAPSASVEMRDDRPAISVNGSMLVCRGTVTAHFLNGRDASMIPWAVTEVDCASWGGMSGGPVFDQHGKLFGVLCSSLNDDAGSGTSYVSMLWPALDVPFEGGWPQPWSTGTSSLLSIDERICHIDRRESVVTDVDPKTGARRTYYVRWE